MKRENIPFLIDVAEAVNIPSIKAELQNLAEKASSSNTPIILPLVGEFSSGKTTLINALTDSHALETATKPTTATIFEVHFGAPSNHAEILFEDGHIEQTDDLKTLYNEKLKDAKVVTVFDTSTKVSPYTILVDTPGISSPEPKHRQTLVDFLPAADGIILVIDINQQLTKSLSEFIKTAKLSNKELYVVLTHSDTKSSIDVSNAKTYFAQNCELEVKQIAAISGSKNEISELFNIFADIESRKEEIVRKADEKRLDIIAKNLTEQINILLSASTNDEELEEKVSQQRQKLNKMNRQIEKMIQNVELSLEPVSRDANRKFEDQVSAKLSALVTSGSKNYDAEAVSAINVTATAIIGDYRQKVMSIITQEVYSKKQMDALDLSSLPGIDLSSISISGLSYGLNLNEMGHEYDSWIKKGVIAIATVATVTAVAATGGGAVAAAEGTMAIDTIADVADTVTDVGSVLNNRKVASRIENAVKYGQQDTDKNEAIVQLNSEEKDNQGSRKGIIDSLTGFIAEKTMSKPQRSRAIRLYINDSLSPEFKTQIAQATTIVLNAVRTSLGEAAKTSIEETTNTLNQLKDELKNKKEATMERMNNLRKMQTQLMTLN